jgi:hypothetical protein
MTTEAESRGQAPTPPEVDRDLLDKLGVLRCGLKESVHNLEILYQGTTGECCPRCGGKEFGKHGKYTYKGKSYPNKICRNCGRIFSIVDFQKEGSTQNRATRILNLDSKKGDDLIEATLQFGLIKKNNNDTYSVVPSRNKTKLEIYNNVPLYRYLIETVGYNLKRCIFEDALKSNPDVSLDRASSIKRDTLWRTYQEIAVEIFVCEKTCKFSRTCKKDPQERYECDTVKKTRVKKRVWRVDIEL